jgi:ABC-type taurine transport system substrate-binding protein
MTIEELLQKLRELKRPSTILGKTEYFPVIDSQHFHEVETLIRQFALDNHDAELGTLKAKVYAYEQIIANSNFAPMIVEMKKSGEVIEDGNDDF